MSLPPPPSPILFQRICSLSSFSLVSVTLFHFLLSSLSLRDKILISRHYLITSTTYTMFNKVILNGLLCYAMLGLRSTCYVQFRSYMPSFLSRSITHYWVQTTLWVAGSKYYTPSKVQILSVLTNTNSTWKKSTWKITSATSFTSNTSNKTANLANPDLGIDTGTGI